MYSRRGLQIAYIGDDLTGSVDVMEALSTAALGTTLFLQPPDLDELKRAAEESQAIGIATTIRSQPPAESQAIVGRLAGLLSEIRPPLLHLKTCSTLDSSPDVGCIGAAVDAALDVLEAAVVPVLIAAPRLGRYCAFGNLFARSGSGGPAYRLDRHPTMSAHPVTPMDESDIGVHLGKQTSRRIGLVDVRSLRAGIDACRGELAAQRSAGAELVVIDQLSEDEAPLIGDLLWNRSEEAKPLLVVGSSGVEHALVAYWSASDSIGPDSRPYGGVVEASRVDQLLAVVGSCSPVTRQQVLRAIEGGFVEVALPAHQLGGSADAERLVDRADRQLRAALSAGRSAIVHSFPPVQADSGPPQISESVAPATVGAALGDLACTGIDLGVPRIAVAGGDVSGYVMERLGVRSVAAVAPFAPAMPVCRGYVPGCARDVEFVFKGGQTGAADFFLDVQRGCPSDVRRSK